jgi:CheY-like chemotaxis protein
MDQKNGNRYIVIDDDVINNHLCYKYIKISVPDAIIDTFTDPEKALVFINETYPLENCPQTIILLDINMPVLNGWEVLDKFGEMSEAIRKQFITYILSSSVSHEDKEMAEKQPLVSGFIEKPLSTFKIKTILAGIN